MFRKILVYLASVLFCCVLSVWLGSELITLYEMQATGLQRHELGDDLGLGILLFLGLLPELVIGAFLGHQLAKRVNAKLCQTSGRITTE